MKLLYPSPLQSGDTVMVIAPSSPSTYIRENVMQVAKQRFNELGLQVKFAPNFHSDLFISTPESIQNRVDDIHTAFADKTVKCIFTILGGYHCNQLLDLLDFDLIKNNPKVFCGFSDITALNNAILAQTGLVTFCGPYYSSFGMLRGFEFTMDAFKKAIMSDKEFDINVSTEWADDPWYRDQENRTFIKNSGAPVMHDGAAHGNLIGGNLSTFALLQGTKYMPSDFDDIVLFVEDDSESSEDTFIRQLNGVLMQDFANKIRGILVGRFQKSTNPDIKKIYQTIQNRMPNVPVIMNLDFGHTTPLLTIPTGAYCKMNARGNEFEITISRQE